MTLAELDDIWIARWPPNTQPKFIYNRPTFEHYVGNSGKAWLVPAVTVLPNQADHIYVTAYADWNKFGTGFGGRTLVMPLIDGGYFHLKGGWHSRAEALLADTGIDTRNQRLTYGAVALHRTSSMDLFGILYEDTSPQLGTDDRIVKIAQKIANERNEPVFYSYLSAGGASSAMVKPEEREVNSECQ